MDPRISDFAMAQLGIGGLVVLALGAVLLKLAIEFAKLRTELQHGLTRDLLNKRFDAYAALWTRLGPLAIYTDDLLTPQKARELSEGLTEWYFSPVGGMFLTTRARDFYFALQDLLWVVAELKGWECVRRSARPRERFSELLAKVGCDNRRLRISTSALSAPESIDPLRWRMAVEAVAKQLQSLACARSPDLEDTIFAVVQQVSSVLRSNLAYELSSRLAVRIP
jgi:hypothetical protein